MDPDFTALASRVAARAEVLGCVILSRDGLVLGSFPPNGEGDITPGLLRFAQLGDPDRGFVQFSDELWAYVAEGSYAAFAVAGPGTRPGILIDYLEQALQVAEEARVNRSAVSEPQHVDLSPKVARVGRGLRATSTAPPEELRVTMAAPVPAVAPAWEAPTEAPGAPDDPQVPAGPPDFPPETRDVGVKLPDEVLPSPPEMTTGPPDVPTEPEDVPTEPETVPTEPETAPAEPQDGADEFAETLAEAVQADDNDRPDAAAAAPALPITADVAPAEAGLPPELAIGDPSPGTVPDEGSATQGENEGARSDFDIEFGDPETSGDAPSRTGSDAPRPGPESPEEIDRVALAREFAQLLQDAPGLAESAGDPED